MKRYFFHIRHDGELIQDLEGSLIADDNAAVAEAVGAAREIVVDTLKQGRPILTSSSIEIVDANGRLIDKVPFQAVVEFK